MKQDYARQVRENVARHGFHVTYVSSSDDPAFCYSTGIYKTHSIPELFLSALPPNLSHELITQYVDRHRNVSPQVGQRIKAEDERFDYYLIPVATDLLTDYALASFAFYGDERFEYLQLVYPDASLRFPHEPGYDYDQVLLTEFHPDP